MKKDIQRSERKFLKFCILYKKILERNFRSIKTLRKISFFLTLRNISSNFTGLFNKVAWPSGLRRWFKAQVSQKASVRIPPLPIEDIVKKVIKKKEISFSIMIFINENHFADNKTAIWASHTIINSTKQLWKWNLRTFN